MIIVGAGILEEVAGASTGGLLGYVGGAPAFVGWEASDGTAIDVSLRRS